MDNELAVAESSSNVVATRDVSNFLGKAKPKKVLDEEAYTKNVERIIVRDFFPDHETLKDQIDYLDAEKRKDFEKMRKIALKYSGNTARLKTPGTTGNFVGTTPLPSPASFETPTTLKRPSTGSTIINEGGDNMGYGKVPKSEVDKKDVKESDKNVSLDNFLSKYTSEDNQSFEVIMDRSDQQHRDKHAWLYEAEINHKMKTEEILQLEQPEILSIESSEGQAVNSKEVIVKAVRETIPVNTWEYKNKNALMYYPEGLNDDSAFKKPRSIIHSNTRFNGDPFKVDKRMISEAAGSHKQFLPEKVGHDGVSIIPEQSPKVKGYGMLATPSPMPGVTDSPIMTWGMIEGTPVRLDATPSSGRTPGPSFRFPEESERDKLTHRMVDRNTKKNRAKKQVALDQMKASVMGDRKTPQRFGSVKSLERFNTLSPAARKLVGKKYNMGSALRSSYTPSPLRKRGNETPLAQTPKSVKTPTPKTTVTPSRTITENIIKNLEKKQRKTATDFF